MFFVYAILFILGLILGSYINSWVWRIKNNKWRWGGRSVCIHCARQLAGWENIPLASFLALRGRCRTCKKPIPADYFWVELATALLFVGVAYYHLHLSNFNSWHFFRDLFFVSLLIVIFIYDLKYQIILSSIVWAGAIIALIFNLLIFRFSIYFLFIGMAVGGGFFLLQYLASRGRWIGGGDMRLGVMMGALLGWPNVLAALFISYILGAVVSLFLVVVKKVGIKTQIPFGTFLAIGTFFTMLYGNNIVVWYLFFLW